MLNIKCQYREWSLAEAVRPAVSLVDKKADKVTVSKVTVDKITVTRGNGFPLYLQLKREIELRVKKGWWEPGLKLPPEREMARLLGVSRNTVSAAYRQLEDQGLLVSRQGRGTFVGRSSARPSTLTEGKVLHALGLAWEELASLGYGPEEFLDLAREVVSGPPRAVRVALVECNREQLDYFSRELELGSGVRILPVLVEDFRRNPGAVNALLEGVDLVVTTFFHLDEVRGLVADPNKEILGIALDPLMETMVKIALLPRRKKTGLVCRSEAFAERVQKSLANAGIELELAVTTTADRRELGEFLRGVKAAIVSPGRFREVEALMPPGRKVIEFIYQPDAGSINLLRAAVRRRKAGMG